MAKEEAMFDRRNYYVGETLNQMRHGYGVFFYKNKFFRYEGDWVKGKKHGHGSLYMEDGSYYEGEFKDGEIEGHGFRKWQHTGNCYSGEFYKGEMQGHGVMNYADGTQYQGGFFQNQRHGGGILKGPGNLVYEGSWYKNKKHGQGIQEFDNGDEYEGDWIEGRRQGDGEMKYADGSIYEGQWRDNMCNGQGLLSHVSGVVYEGLWVNDVPDVESAQIIPNLPHAQSHVDVIQGDRFSIQLLVIDDRNEPNICERGREFQISAGYKIPPTSKSSPSQSLLGLIEGIETKPIKTSLGFDVLPYPLVKAGKDEEGCDEMSLRPKAPSSPFIPRTTASEVIHEAKESVSETSKTDDVNLDIPDEASSPRTGSKPEASVIINDNEDQKAVQSSRLPPPLIQRSSNDGVVEFTNLLLPSAVDGFRFYVGDDEVYSSMSSTPTGSTHSMRRGTGGASGVSGRSEKKRSRGSRTTSAASSSSASLGADGKGGKGNKSKGSDSDEKGEYVMIIEEVTNPPFMGKLLPPAYVLVKVAAPKKPVVKKTGGGKKSNA